MSNNNDSPVNNERLTQLKRKVQWYVKVRWFFLLGLATPGIVAEYAAHGVSRRLAQYLVVAIGGLAYNTLFYLLAHQRHKSLRFYQILASAQMTSDVILASYLIFANGGIESRTILIYALPILMAGAIFGRLAVFCTAILSALIYDAIIILDSTGLWQPLNIRMPVVHHDGGYLAVTIVFYSVALLIVAAVANFVTGLLIEQEIQTRSRTESLAMAQHLAKIGSWEWDVTQNRITWSDELYRMFGVGPTQFDGQFEGYLHYIHPDDRASAQAVINQALVDHQPFSFDHRILLTDNTERVVHAEGQVSVNGSGQPVSLYGTAQDVTERYRVQKDLERRTKELEKLNQLMVGRELRMIELKRQLQEAQEVQDAKVKSP